MNDIQQIQELIAEYELQKQDIQKGKDFQLAQVAEADRQITKLETLILALNSLITSSSSKTQDNAALN